MQQKTSKRLTGLAEFGVTYLRGSRDPAASPRKCIWKSNVSMRLAAVLNTSWNITKNSVLNAEKDMYTLRHTKPIDTNRNYCWKRWTS